MKNFVLRIFIFFSIFSIWSHFRLDGFSEKKVIVESEEKESIQTFQTFEELTPYISQKFTYLAKGHQCFVFASQDGKYVIKLINHRRFDIPLWIKPFTFVTFIQNFKEKRCARKDPSVKSYFLAYEQLRRETGIIHMQIGKSAPSHYKISLIDKAHIPHEIDLGKVDFIVQKKVESIENFLYEASRKKETLQKALRAILENIASRAHKSIIDEDVDIWINYGYLEGKSILVDPGRLVFKEDLTSSIQREKEMRKSTKLLRKWLLKNYPDLLPFFEKTLVSLAK